MKTKIQILLMVGLMFCGWGSISAQPLTQFTIKGRVVYVEDRHNLLSNSIRLGDQVVGQIKFDPAGMDNNADATVGDYWYYKKPNASK